MRNAIKVLCDADFCTRHQQVRNQFTLEDMMLLGDQEEFPAIKKSAQ